MCLCHVDPHTCDDLGETVAELRMQLDRERRTCLSLEEKVRELEASIFPAGLHLTYEPHESLGVLDHNTPPTSEAEEGETLEVMEVPLPLNSEEIHDEILSSAVSTHYFFFK